MRAAAASAFSTSARPCTKARRISIAVHTASRLVLRIVAEPLAFVPVAFCCAVVSAVMSARNATMVIVGEPNSPAFPEMPSYIACALNWTPGTFFFVVAKLARGLAAVLMSSSFSRRHERCPGGVEPLFAARTAPASSMESLQEGRPGQGPQNKVRARRAGGTSANGTAVAPRAARDAPCHDVEETAGASRPPSKRQFEQPAAQLWITRLHTVTESPQGMVVQSVSVHGAQAPAALQLVPATHVPQVTLLPQPSGAVPQTLLPQGFAAGTQQALVWHLSVDGHVLGQVIVPPHPSGTLPHATPAHAWAGVMGAQHAFEWHTSAVGHVPGQVIVPPHPSATVPHAMPVHACDCVFGVQHADPLHTAGATHVLGHCNVPPQPFGAVPQITLPQTCDGMLGVQQAPASHTVPAAHIPHCTVAPHASVTGPQTTPSS